jgi:hypothetical protein
MGCWSMGVLERWVSVHHSSTPPLHYSNHLGWSEAIERNEAYESFSAVLLDKADSFKNQIDQFDTNKRRDDSADAIDE